MKTKNIKLKSVLLGLLVLVGCGQDFLSVKPKGTQLESDFYKDRDQAYGGLVAVYDVVGYMSGGLVTKVGAVNSASDDHFAGGGSSTDMNVFQVWDNYTLNPSVGPQGDLWAKGYSGVFRANILLSKLDGVPMDETEKARFIAETKFLRAYFYFDLVRLFKNIPLLLEPVTPAEMYNILQATPEDVYKQIEDDLKAALPNLPATVAGAERARATSGAAHALLGKVYLYEKKYTEAAAELAEVNGETPGAMNAKYGYNLVSNFGDLFKTSNKFNSESIFEISFTNTSAGTWNCSACTEGNILNIMSGPRNFKINSGFENSVPNYVSGWSFFTITPDLISVIKNDPRYPYTVADIKGMQDDGEITYTPGYNDTGYFLEKYAAKVADKWTGAGNYELNFAQNIYEIRLADTYLMEAEALVAGGGDTDRAKALLSAVRDRVGLTEVEPTLDNIWNERRLEFVGEGHRWFDLVRTGQAKDKLAFKGFVEGKHEILPIPILELSNTKLEQSKEWGGTK